MLIISWLSTINPVSVYLTLMEVQGHCKASSLIVVRLERMHLSRSCWRQLHRYRSRRHHRRLEDVSER